MNARRVLAGPWRKALANASRWAGLGWAAIQEIFEESAYRRFLERYQMLPSRQSYAAFLREQNTEKERRPRCC